MIPMPPIGFHCLREFEQRGPAYWRAVFLDKTIPRSPSTTAQVRGTAVHACALEGRAALEQRFATAPAGEWDSQDRKVAQEVAGGTLPLVIAEMPNRRTKLGKEAWAAIEMEAAGRRILTLVEGERLAPLAAAYAATAGRDLLSAYEFDLVLRMAAAVRQHPEAIRLIEGGQVELELAGRLRVDGAMGPAMVPIRGRLDIIGPGYIADLKTADDISELAFDRTIVSLEYYRQLSLYDQLRQQNQPEQIDGTSYIIAVEVPEGPLAPVRVSVQELSFDYLLHGHQRNLEGLARLAGAFMTDAWSPLAPGVRQVHMPRWLSYK